MSEVVYVSKIRIERKMGPLRIAYLPGESQPVIFSVHGGIAKHYQGRPGKNWRIPRGDHRLCDRFNGWLNDGHFWRRAGSATD
jgi:hypothetical protein